MIAVERDTSTIHCQHTTVRLIPFKNPPRVKTKNNNGVKEKELDISIIVIDIVIRTVIVKNDWKKQ